jgi:uncharacterized protein YaiI (UPF0178 family)
MSQASPVIYIDADACPVKDEVYKVARRYSVSVVVVANATLRIPNDPHVSLLVRAGFGGADDLIAETIGAGDIAITADIPLAARCVAKGAAVLDPKGRLLTEANIGEAVGIRDLMDELRKTGDATGGPAPMTPRDRSRFLSKLDELINTLKRGRTP